MKIKIVSKFYKYHNSQPIMCVDITTCEICNLIPELNLQLSGPADQIP